MPPFPGTVRYFAALGLALAVVGAVVGVVAVCVPRIGLLELGSVCTLGLIFGFQMPILDCVWRGGVVVWFLTYGDGALGGGGIEEAVH